MTEMRLLVTPETVVHPRWERTGEPYLRVHRIEAGGDPLLVSKTPDVAPEALVLDGLDNILLERLRGYAEINLAEWRNDDIDRQPPDGIDYNCYSAADFIGRGVRIPEHSPSHAALHMDAVAGRGNQIADERDPSLPLGKIAVVASPDIGYPAPVLHSGLSLGPKKRHLLSITSMGGWIGLEPLSSMVDYCRSNAPGWEPPTPAEAIYAFSN